MTCCLLFVFLLWRRELHAALVWAVSTVDKMMLLVPCQGRACAPFGTPKGCLDNRLRK